MSRISKLVCFVLAILPSTLLANTDLLVEYTIDGTDYRFMGEKTAPRTYVWNKGAEKIVHITTLDWMPYIGENICKQGWVQQVTVALLTSRGYEVKSTFYPWARTIKLAERGEADILYPEWYIESSAPSDVIKDKKRRDNLMLSDRIPGGPIAFMKRKGEADNYKGNLQNLKGERIGVVRGYQNTPEFDALMDSGFFKVDKAKDDFQQAMKLLNNRNNLIINDPFVVRNTIQNSDLSESEKAEHLNQLEVVQPTIQYNYLYYAVAKNKDGWETIHDEVNKAIQRFESSGVLFDIINNTLKTCGQNMKETFDPYLKAKPVM